MIIFMRMVYLKNQTFSLLFSETFFEDFIVTQQVAPTIHDILSGASINPFHCCLLEC